MSYETSLEEEREKLRDFRFVQLLAEEFRRQECEAEKSALQVVKSNDKNNNKKEAEQ